MSVYIVKERMNESGWMTNVILWSWTTFTHPFLSLVEKNILFTYLLTFHSLQLTATASAAASVDDEIAVSNDSCKNRVEKVYFLDTQSLQYVTNKILVPVQSTTHSTYSQCLWDDDINLSLWSQLSLCESLK